MGFEALLSVMIEEIITERVTEILVIVSVIHRRSYMFGDSCDMPLVYHRIHSYAELCNASFAQGCELSEVYSKLGHLIHPRSNDQLLEKLGIQSGYTELRNIYNH